MIIKILFVFFISVLSISVLAEMPPLKLSAGYGAIIKSNNRFDNNYTTRSDTVVTTIPMLNLHFGPLMLGASGLTVSFYGNKDISAYLNFNHAGERYYGTNMDKRKESWMTGIGLKYFSWNFILAKDISHRSYGIRFAGSYSYLKILNDSFTLRTGISLEYFSSHFTNYYYGVRSHEISATRAYYSPKGHLIPGLNVFLISKFFDKINLSSGLSIKKNSDVIINSPTTRNLDFDISLILGLSWIFY